MKGHVRCCAVIVIVSAIGQATAGSITYTANFNNRLPLPSLPGFDSSLDQLTQVDLNIAGQASGTWSPLGTSISSGTFHILFEALVDGSFVGSVQTSEPFTFDSPTNLFPMSGSFNLKSTLTTDLDLFETPQVNLYFYVSAYFTDTGAFMQGNLSSVSGTEAITYTFAVPEPPGAMMAGTASLIGLGFWLWRRKPLSIQQP